MAGLGKQPVVDDCDGALVGERDEERQFGLVWTGHGRGQEHRHDPQDLLAPRERDVDSCLPVELLERGSDIWARPRQPARLGVRDDRRASAQDDVSVGQVLDAQPTRQRKVAEPVGDPWCGAGLEVARFAGDADGTSDGAGAGDGVFGEVPENNVQRAAPGQLRGSLPECPRVASCLASLGGVAEDGSAVPLTADVEGHVRPGDFALGPVGAKQRRRPQPRLAR